MNRGFAAGLFCSWLAASIVNGACPAGATGASSVTMRALAFRAGKMVAGSGSVYHGETVQIRLFLFNEGGLDENDERRAAFQGGSVAIVINGQTNDVTPLAGIPVVGGDDSCPGTNIFVSETISHEVLQDGSLIVHGYYTGGRSMAERPLPVSANSLTYYPVTPEGPIRITGSALAFHGTTGRTYHVESSIDFKDWAVAGDVAPDTTGWCHFPLGDEVNPARFYRYRYSW